MRDIIATLLIIIVLTLTTVFIYNFDEAKLCSGSIPYCLRGPL